MAGRRFLPLIAAVALGALALIARLYQVQIAEREVWAAEAANLVRAGTVRPYRRGSILDARGRVLAQDVRVWRVQLDYREFRRGHPLGMVAHARSALLGRPISLADALASLPQWSEELVQLTAADLEAFGNGEPIALGAEELPGTNDCEADLRRWRRGDVRYYVARLFDLDPSESRDFTKAVAKGSRESLIEIGARVRGTGDAAALAERLSRRVEQCVADLRELAEQLDRDEAPQGAQTALSALDRLVARLEQRRSEVEDDCASELFAQACGFPAGRVESSVVFETIDLVWIERLLQWDDARTFAWLERARAKVRESLLTGQIERLATELEVEGARDDLPRRILGRWTELFAADPLARSDPAPVVLGELSRLFAGAAEADAATPLSFEPWLGETREREVTFATLAELELGAGASEAERAALAQAWERAFGERFDRAFLHEHSRGVVAGWEQELQRAVLTALEAARGGGPRLALAEGRLDRAVERARYILKDRGSRTQLVARAPSYATVHLLSRHADRYAGFRVDEAGERVRLEDERGIAIAGGLLGSVAAPTLKEELAERDLRERFDDLRRKGSRSEDEDAELRWMARRIARPDEPRGRSGLESYFDRELAGRNGYREVRGLQEVLGGTFDVDVPPEDGSDLTLTLDLDLQKAATAALAHPEGDPVEQNCDYEWLARPTGAIVLMGVGGDVLAAASFPDFVRDPSDRPAARDLPFERTLRKPTFQPPGSSWKPFVACWAIDHVEFDPMRLEACAMLADGRGAGYVDVRCAQTRGHGEVDLRDALKRSCNAYFAQLGERFSNDDFSGMAAEFGFGRATGVQSLGERRGWLEDRVPNLFARPIEGRSARLAGNGLAVVEATPMQLARATAALATGVLPEVRLVRRFGAVEAPSRSRKLAISSASLGFVREAMRAVAEEPGGSAEPALNSRGLGFRIGAKTGSGDIGTTAVVGADGRERVRKHTWLIGFFPFDAPRYVVVVFCHDTLQTASHGAIWLARQFLRSEPVQQLVREEAR